MPAVDSAVNVFLIFGLKQVGVYLTDLGSSSAFRLLDKLKLGKFSFLDECSRFAFEARRGEFT